MLLNKDSLLNIFNILNDEHIEYVLMHNIDNELPDNLKIGKDIDIVVKRDSKARFGELMHSNGWTKIRHPINYVFLYAMDKFDCYRKNNFSLDCHYQLYCRSLQKMEGAYMVIPLHQIIQDSVWRNRQKNPKWPWYEMCPEDEIVHLVSRSIFAKGGFSSGYIRCIEELLPKANEQELLKRFQVVFFAFAKKLFDMLKMQEYTIILDNYLKFTDY